MSTHPTQDHQHNTSPDHTTNQRSTPSAPDHEINSPPPNRTTTQRSQHEDRKIKTQDRKSGAHRGITILRGVRAGARRRTTTPCGDLPTVVVDLVGGGVWC
jgi:hypothetical protein